MERWAIVLAWVKRAQRVLRPYVLAVWIVLAREIGDWVRSMHPVWLGVQRYWPDVAAVVLTLLVFQGLVEKGYFSSVPLPFMTSSFEQRMLMMLAAAVSGFAIGWLISPAAKAVRRALLVSALTMMVAIAVVDEGAMGLGAATLVAILVFMAGVGHGMRALARAFFAGFKTFGSASWADLPELEARGLFGQSGLLIGHAARGAQLEPLHYKGDKHALTVGKTRGGKGATAIIPNLLLHDGSALVIDPKGENAMATAATRSGYGAVHVVDPWGIATGTGFATARFNPLDWLKPGDMDITENAMLLADALVVSQGVQEQFWTEEAKALLQGVILHVATDPAEAGQRHLGRVRDLLLLDADESKALFSRMLESAHHVVASTGARCLQKDEKLLSNVMASAQAQTHFLDSPRMRDSLSGSDFRFEDLKSGVMTVYLVLPSDRLNAFGRWLRLLIQQAITVTARDIAHKPARPILFLLDEMAALGRLTMVEQAYGLMAGYGMLMWGIVQDFSQLKRNYGDSWETFISNSGVLQYYGSRDRMTADYFSALCGVTTVWTFSSAVSRSFAAAGSSRSESETHSPTQRKLVFPDELMRLPDGRQLLLVENMNPIMAHKVPWFAIPAMAAIVNVPVKAA
jgi:type IV secretion system protein VirD4